MNKQHAVGQSLLGTTWGTAAGRYDDYRNGRYAWFKGAKFGIFIHWGLYSLLEGEWRGTEYRGIAEWIMRKLEIPVADYAALAGKFDPKSFDADAWLDLFQEAGAQYVTITAKHHDGFCLFGSQASGFNSVAATPARRDYIAEVSAACARHGQRLCLYYSQDQDWHEPQGGGNDWNFPPASRTDAGRRAYVEEKVIPQLKELLTQYGPVGYLWFDTPGYLCAEEARRIKEAVGRLQPECLSSSRLGHELGDFESLPDQRVPEAVHHHRCETAMTHNDSWAYSKFDRNWKTPETLIRQLVTTVGCGANYLLNVGPNADGTIPAESVAALKAIGRWLRINGESIYNALPSPIGCDLPWGACTARAGRLYLHVFEQPSDNRLLVPWSGAARRARLLATGGELPVEPAAEGLVIVLPSTLPDPVATVVVLELAEGADRPPLIMANQTNVLRASGFSPDAGSEIRNISWMHETFGNWHHRDILVLSGPGARAVRTVRAAAAGSYRLWLEYDSRPDGAEGWGTRNTLDGRASLAPLCKDVCRGTLRVAGVDYALRLPPVTPGYFETVAVCDTPIHIAAGACEITIIAGCENFPELVSLRLVPQRRVS